MSKNSDIISSAQKRSYFNLDEQKQNIKKDADWYLVSFDEDKNVTAINFNEEKKKTTVFCLFVATKKVAKTLLFGEENEFISL
jgi:hypothetical protein